MTMLDRDIEDTRQAPEYPEEIILCDFCGDEKEISAIFGKQNCCQDCLQQEIDELIAHNKSARGMWLDEHTERIRLEERLKMAKLIAEVNSE
jgi:hypothetical protein